MEHIAYREISTVCTMMNAPLCLLSASGGKKKENCLAEIMKCSPFYHPRALVQEFSLETGKQRSVLMNAVELAIISRVLVKTLCVLYIELESGTTSSHCSSLKMNEESFSLC